MSACLFANLSFFICFDILRISETAVSDSDFYLLLKFYEKSLLSRLEIIGPEKARI